MLITKPNPATPNDAWERNTAPPNNWFTLKKTKRKQ